MRKLGLRGKFLGGLVIAAALPLGIGLIFMETWAYRHLLAERGRAHQVEAVALQRLIRQATEAQGEQFRTWLAADPSLLETVGRRNRQVGSKAPEEVTKETRRLDAAWGTLPDDNPDQSAILNNPGSSSLRRYLALHPENVEAFATDRTGALVAATGKTTDYDQADEEWWRKGRTLRPGEAWTDQLNYDASADTFTLDVVVPLFANEVIQGVGKLSLDVSSLFSRLGFDGEEKGERWEIALPDGRILASSKAGFSSLRDRLEPETLDCIRKAGARGTLQCGRDEDTRMAGFVTLGNSGEPPRAYLLFSSRRDDVVAPLRRQLRWLGGGAILLVLACGIAGYAFIHRKILGPLDTLGNAARSVSETADLSLGSERDEREAYERRRAAEADLEKIRRIHTGDEVERLADDLAVMTARVLSYHRQLESEVAAKTAVIREDLELAREFQNALLPSEYPQIPKDTSDSPLRLRFAHFYQPAATIGGDFFDLIQLDENRVGVLIADVMGHGARSALITATLRALVQNYCVRSHAPGDFLGELNRHLYEVIARSGHTLFVTAFFMTLDARAGVVSWAVAGHPSPLHARRGSGEPPRPLWTRHCRQPALGLLPDVIYRTMESPMKAGEVFLLFTDGVTEAERPDGTPFGLERLMAGFDEALDGPMAAMPARIVDLVSSFQRRAQYEDDVCIVAVEVLANLSAGPPAHEEPSAAHIPPRA